MGHAILQEAQSGAESLYHEDEGTADGLRS